MITSWTELSELRAAWRRVRRNKGTSGGDGQTLNQFRVGANDRLKKLQKQLRSGAYVPGPLRRVEIKKPNGGVRILAIPSVRDRVAQAACAAAFDREFDPYMSDASFAYRRGRSVEHAAGLVLAYRLRGYAWAVDADIQSFFDTIPHEMLISKLVQRIECQATMTTVSTWLRSFSADGCGVAQGSPISPVLANVYLMDLDTALDRKGARIVRYADDFLIVCHTRQDAQKALVKAHQVLAGLGLTLNGEKTCIVDLAKGVEFLGILFQQSNVTRLDRKPSNAGPMPPVGA